VATSALGHAICTGKARNPALHADGFVSQLLVFGDIFECRIHVYAIGVCIDQDTLAALAAKQVVDRSVQGLTLDVPQRDVHCRDCRHCNRTTPPICSAVEILPDVFALKWIPADDAWNHVLCKVRSNSQL